MLHGAPAVTSPEEQAAVHAQVQVRVRERLRRLLSRGVGPQVFVGLAVAERPLRTIEIAARAGRSYRAVYVALCRAHAAGLVTRARVVSGEPGKVWEWTLTPDGRAFADTVADQC